MSFCPSSSAKVWKAHSEKKSHPRENNGEVNQRPETISETNEHDRDRRLEQHRIQGSLEPGIKRSKEGREISFLSGDVYQSGCSEE